MITRLLFCFIKVIRAVHRQQLCHCAEELATLHSKGTMQRSLDQPLFEKLLVLLQAKSHNFFPSSQKSCAFKHVANKKQSDSGLPKMVDAQGQDPKFSSCHDKSLFQSQDGRHINLE